MTVQNFVGPSPRVYGVAIHDRAVLLVRAANPHDGEDIWWLPGGGIDWGESPIQTLEREFVEETGLAVTHQLLHSVVDDQRIRPNGERVHTVRIIYVTTVKVAPLQHEADGSTDFVTWVPLDELNSVRLAQYAETAIGEVAGLLRSTEPSEQTRSLAPFREAAAL